MPADLDGPAQIRVDAVANPGRLIFEAVMRPPEGASEDQRRFLRQSYLRALRRAQGWDEPWSTT